MSDSEPTGERYKQRRNFFKLSLAGVFGAALGGKFLDSCAQPDPNNESAKIPENQPKTPSPTEIKEQLPELSVSGFIESNFEKSNNEIVKFVFSDGFTNLEKPIFEKGDVVEIRFNLDSQLSPKSLFASASNMFGINIPVSESKEIDDSPGNGFSLLEFAKLLPQHAQSFGKKLEIGELSLETIDKIKFVFGTNNDDLIIRIVLPNTPYTYTDETGNHEINPLQRFLNGEMGIEMKREDSSVNPPEEPVIISKFVVYSNKQEKIVYQQKPENLIELQPPRKITIQSSGGIDKTEATDLSVQSEESRWTKEWNQNETISIRDWWNDMIEKGYIRIDSTAQKFAGDKISAMLDNILVPNPHEYYKSGKPFIGGCVSTLNELISTSQGHISISSEALSQIPGGSACQIFVK